MISNNKNFIFIFCLFLSIETLGSPGKTLKTAAEELAGKIEYLFKKGAKASNKKIKREFDRTLDEVLETMEISREDIPEHVLNQLRNVTLDPLRLIDIDSPYRIDNLSIFFRPGHDENLANVYRAFLQKRIDLNNREQMDRLAVLVDRFVDMFDTPVHAQTLSRRDVLIDLFIHKGVIEHSGVLSGMLTPEFDAWLVKLYRTLYKNETFQEVAKNSFKDSFDGETFFNLWKDQSFRDFIVESRFMTKEHLTGNPELLIRWTDELEKHPDGLRQLHAFIESSFREAYNTYDVDQVPSKDSFWTTVLKAIREDSDFAFEVKRILRDITPVREDQYIPHIGGGSRMGNNG